MFEPQTRIEIAKRIKASIANRVSVAEGTFSADVSSATAIEFEKAYAELGLALEAGFAVTSWGEWLTKRCAEQGVFRKAATSAISVVRVTGSAGSRIIKGSLFATENDVRFMTKEDAVIGAGGTVDIPVLATVAGKTGVVGAGTINKIPMSIPGVTVATNLAASYDGFDEESDESLLERYLIKVRTPATSGNKYHYMQWAREVAGVGRANVLPLWAGNGTVKVVIVDADGNMPSSELISAVAANIEEKRPVGATVTVAAATPKKVKVTAQIVRKKDVVLAAIQEELLAKLTAWIWANYFNTNSIPISQVAGLLLKTTGVVDYTYGSLKLNGVADNVILKSDELPVAEVTLVDS